MKDIVHWLCDKLEDIVKLIMIGFLSWIAWNSYQDYRATQLAVERAEAAENVRKINNAAQALHKAWCNSPPGGLADGSCER